MLDEYGLHPGSDLNWIVGYAQQQDIHLATATVKVPYDSVHCFDSRRNAPMSKEVIDILDMRDFADAVIGLPGEGKACLQRLCHYCSMQVLMLSNASG